MTMFIYRHTEPSLWTVGFYTPAGAWEPESDCGDPDEAAARVAWLNGGREENNGRPSAADVLHAVLNQVDNGEQCRACDAVYDWDNNRSYCPQHAGAMEGYDRAMGEIAETAVAFQRDPELADTVVERAEQLRIHEFELMQQAEADKPAPEGLSEHEKQQLRDAADVPADPRWAPAEQHVPHLLADLMHMGTVRYSGRQIEQYKHIDTRNYLNLDHTGQAWEVAVAGDTGAVGARRLAVADALAHLEGHSG